MISRRNIEKPVIVLGAGGHAKVVIDSLRALGHEIIGIVDPYKEKFCEYYGLKVLGDDQSILNYKSNEVVLANGIGSIPGNNLRHKIINMMNKKGYEFIKFIHPLAIVASDLNIGAGVQIMSGVIIQPGVKIGNNSIINTGVVIDHDCIIHKDCHLAPGVTLSGNVVVNSKTHIGTGTSIIQNVNIGHDCEIAAGSVIFKDIPNNTKIIQKRETHSFHLKN